MKWLLADRDINYTGEQLRSLWALSEFGAQGDCIVAFLGAADVGPDMLVDVQDVRAGSHIYSPRMLHFIAEHFDPDLEKAICRQRLLICITKEELERRVEGLNLRRRGDDLYDGDLKLSVSIATVSPVSTLIHLGLNVATDGVPVPARGLDDWGVEPREVGRAVAEAYVWEVQDIRRARAKVRA
ncbi:MAG: DUF366 family protein, partial [Armatimonadota bacterium]